MADQIIDNRSMTPWRSAIVQAEAEQLRIRGYAVGELMSHASFAEVVFLLHRGRLPAPAEARLLNAVLIASADHGAGAPSCATARLAASGNRQSVSAAVAAGLLAIGDEHGGAGALAMEMIAAATPAMTTGQQSAAAAAVAAIEHARAEHRRLPGLGHRTHTRDPRVTVLFEMAEAEGMAGHGIAFMRALESAAAVRIKPLPLNIDGALAAVLHDLGFPPIAGKLIFIVGRAAGLTAEVAEELEREKPMRIRIPVDYDGPAPRRLKTTAAAPSNRGHGD